MKGSRRAILVVLTAALHACGGDSPSVPLEVEDETPPPDTIVTPPPESGEFHLAFDGVDDRVLVPWDESFPTEVFTATAWIRLMTPQGRAAIIARGEDDNSFNLSWQLFVNPSGRFEAMLEASNEDNYCYPGNDCVPQGVCESDDTFVADGEWHHVALTRDAGAVLVFYVDGVERARCENTGVPSSNNRQFLSFGATHGTIGPPPGGVEPPTWFFPGEIDDPAMWTRSLSAAEIQAVHETGVDVASIGLTGSWSFNEGTGQVVGDRSPAGNHGYLGEAAGPDGADPVWTGESG